MKLNTLILFSNTTTILCGAERRGGGGGGGVSVFIVQTSDRKPMECVNYLIAVYMW